MINELLQRLQGAGVARYLALNAEALTMQSMLNDGKSRDEAMGDARGLRLAAGQQDIDVSDVLPRWSLEDLAVV